MHFIPSFSRCIPVALSLVAGGVQGGQLNLSASGWQDAEGNTFVESPSVERRHYQLGYQWDALGQANRLTYEHQTLLVRAGEPANNGYLHQIDVALSRRVGRWELAADLGTHGSSNMFKHGELHEEALVGTFDIRYQVYHAQVGISGDYRFDDQFRIYPVAARDMVLSDGSKLSVELPVRIEWHNANQWISLGIERYGEKWAALDKDRVVESALYLNEWRAQGKVDVFDSSSYSVAVFAGWSFDTEVSYWDLRDGQIEVELEDSAFAGIEVVW